MSRLPGADVSHCVVLIVDDMPTNIDVLRKILKSEGYEIYAAPSGEIALKIAQRSSPDIILLDVMMPDMDGYETCRQLKSLESTRDIPVIFVTAKTEVQDVVDGFKFGAVDYIHKPVKREEVCARVRTHLQIRSFTNTLQKIAHTEREQAERFRAIINNITEAIFISDEQGVIQLSNPACEHLLGYEAAQLIGQSINTLLPEPYNEEYLAFFACDDHGRNNHAVIGCGPREVEGQHMDSARFPMEISVSEMFLDQPLFICLIQDISVRKGAEQDLMRISRTDPLTNISNRRHFDEVLQQEWQRAMRSTQPLALAMIDVDHFKLFNDHYGHQAGDLCLQKIAAVIAQTAQRPTDLAARFGGEEFTLILPDTDEAGAASIASQLVAQIEALAMPHEMSLTSPCVTISVGLALTIPTQGSSATQLIERADKALYQAKEQGRNGMVCAKPE